MVKPHTPPSATRRPAAPPPRASHIANGSGPAKAARDPAPPPASTPANAAPEPRAAIEPSMFVLPYLEVSRALLRAHHDALAMMEANRTLADALRVIVRRQQDLAFEIAEQAMGRDGDAHPSGDDRASVFDRAAAAVRELGEAMITAQLSALGTLQERARSADVDPDDAATRH